MTAIKIAEALIKPEITECERRLARNPARANPSPMRMAPVSRLSKIAAPKYSGEPGVAIGPIAAAVINEMTATGPTPSVMLEPRRE